MYRKRFLRCILFAALMIGLVPAAMMASEGDPSIQVNGEVVTDTNITINSGDDNTITITGDVTLTGSGDAFTIGADTDLVFAEGASLTLNGYTNGFVVENATVSSANMDIVAQSQMDVFRLKNSGKLDLTGDNSIYGSGKTGTTNRAIVLPGSTSGQAVSLAAGSTLAANNFYRAIETGGAANYTISGANSGLEENAASNTVSTFDFSDNDCGMALSYFDSNVNFKDCVLEVSDCLTSGIFMRQDNASLYGLYIDNVFINCVNDPGKLVDGQNDIAIRFHTVEFSITDSVINIENAWNTGLWICDGWDDSDERIKDIKDTTINVKHVENKVPDAISELFGGVNRRKAITLVPFGTWTIDGCTINIDGASEYYLDELGADNTMEGGINIASDIGVSRNGSLNINDWVVTPRVYSGKIIMKNTSVETSGVIGADIGTQVGQWLEIGDNVVIDNNFEPHYVAVCDNIANGYPVKYFGLDRTIPYTITGMSEEDQSAKRIIVTGGSFWRTDEPQGTFYNQDLFEESTPINAQGEALSVFKISQEQFNAYSTNGAIQLTDSEGQTSEYKVATASGDTYRYIWLPAVTVTFGDTGVVATVPKGAAFGLVGTMENGAWELDGEAFTNTTPVTDNIVVTPAE